MLRVNLNCYGNYTTDSVYQWDQNHVLRITGAGPDIKDITAVHFCNKKCEVATVVNAKLVNNGVEVDIPNKLLQEPYNIIAYVHVYDENQAKTVEVINIPLVKRVKPDDYEFIDNADIANFERLEKDIVDFITESSNDYRMFKTEMIGDYREFTGMFMEEYNDRVDNGYFLDPDSAKNLPLVRSKTGNPVNLSDTAEAKTVEIAVYGESKQEGIPSFYEPLSIKSTADYKDFKIKTYGKNLVAYPYSDGSKTERGITYTVRSDGTVVVNGENTSTSASFFYFMSKDFADALTLEDGAEYILSGCPVGGSANIKLNLVTNVDGVRNIIASDRGEGVRFTAVNDGHTRYDCTIHVLGGTVVDNFVFAPMIRRADIEDDTYERGRKSEILIPLDAPLRSVGEVRDELVYKDGEYGVIRRIGYIESYNGEEITTEYMSTTGDLSTGSSVQYVLTEELFNRVQSYVTERIKKIQTFDSYTTIVMNELGKLRVNYHMNNLSSQLYAEDRARLAEVEISQERETAYNNLLLGYDTTNNFIKYPFFSGDIGVVKQIGDGGLILNGKTSGAIDYTLNDWDYAVKLARSLVGKTIRLSGGTANATFNVICYDENNKGFGMFEDSGSGSYGTIPKGTKAIGLFIRIKSGVTFKNQKVYPMLRLNSIESDTWVPYKKDVNARLDDLDTIINMMLGKIAVVSVSMAEEEIAPNDYFNFSVDLPEGFTYQNCAIISTTLINNSSGTVNNNFIPIYVDASPVQLHVETSISAVMEQIQARFWNLGTSARKFNYTIKYVLYKYA